MIREAFWNWAVGAFGKVQLKQLLSEHPHKDGIFLNWEERKQVYSILEK